MVKEVVNLEKDQIANAGGDYRRQVVTSVVERPNCRRPRVKV